MRRCILLITYKHNFSFLFLLNIISKNTLKLKADTMRDLKYTICAILDQLNNDNVYLIIHNKMGLNLENNTKSHILGCN